MSSRKRTRTGDSTISTRFPDSTSPEATAADLEDGPQKGGHSLRRRARVSYATEQIDDEVVVPNSTSSSASRSKKRHALEDEDSYGPRSKRRTASHGDTPTSSTRRNPARRNTGNRRYHDASDPDDFSPLAEDDQQWEEKPVDTWQSPQSSPSSRVNRTATSYSDSTAVDQPAYQDHSNGDGLQRQNLFTSPVAVEAGTVSAGESANAYGRQSQNEDYYNPDEQLQYESDNQIQNSNMVDYPDFNPEMDETVAPGTESVPAAAAQERNPSLYETHQDMLPEDSSSQDRPIASQATFDEAQVEATPPVDPQLMALMDPGLSRTREPTPAKRAKASTPSLPVIGDDEPRELTPSEADAAEDQQDGSDPIKEPSATGASTPTRTTPGIATDFNKPNEVTPEPADPPKESSLRETLPDEPPAENDKSTRSLDPRWCRPQPTPTGRWANLTPYINGEYTVYPERKPRPEDDDVASEAPSAADKDSDEKDSGKEGEADENGDPQEAATEFPTRAINTPARGSPVADVPDLAAINSPMPPGEEPEDRDSSQEPAEKPKHYRFRKLNDAEEYVNALQDYDNMNTADLYNLLQTIHSSLETWEEEWVEHGKTVDDYENAQRRRTADTKYENRTRNLDQKGISWEEPEFVVKGYKAKDKRMTDTKYLQAQDRTMAAAYGFEYDPHPSKIGKQNPDTQQAGVTTRGRSLRNQPRQTAKATETEGVVGKRQRKAPQAFEPSTQDVSRASSPVPTGRGGRRRRNANAEVEDVAPEPIDNDADGDVEETGPGRRRRGRGKAAAHRILETFAPEEPKADEPTRSSGRRGRPRASIKYKEEAPIQENGDKEATPQRPRRMVTLKLPKGATVTPNGPSPPHPTASRPSTAESDASAHTVESNYSFRPNRQKRFRDGPDDGDMDILAPARKRVKKDATSAEKNKDLVMMDRPIATVEDAATIMQSSREHNHGKQKPKAKGISGPASANGNTPAPTPPPHGPAASASDEFSRNGTPSSQVTAGDDGRDYRTMTKSEKMSASMKSKYRFRMSLEHRANPRQTAGRTATWLAQSRSVRLLSQPRRPRRPPTSRAWEGPSLPNRCPRSGCPRRTRNCFPERTRLSHTSNRRPLLTWLRITTRTRSSSQCLPYRSSRCRTILTSCHSMPTSSMSITSRPIHTAIMNTLSMLRSLSTSTASRCHHLLTMDIAFHPLIITSSRHHRTRISNFHLLTNTSSHIPHLIISRTIASILLTSTLVRVTLSPHQDRDRTLSASLSTKPKC